MQKRKKALAVVAGPYRLLQVLWLTLKYKEYDWSVVLLRYGESLSVVENLKKACLDSGVFQNVYTAITVGRYSTSIQKIRETLRMCFYYIIGKKKEYCLKFITSYIPNFNYQLLCVASSYSFFFCVFLNFAYDIDTLIIQEGASDYMKATTNHNRITNFASEFLYRMGYINLNSKEYFFAYEKCTKYATLPNKLRYRGFKTIERMFDFSQTDKDAFLELISKVFPISVKEYDAVIFTGPLQLYGKNDGYPEVIRFLDDNFKNKRVLVKRHPQDITNYSCKNVVLEDKYSEIPGEILLQHLSNCKIYFFYPSTILIDILGNDRFNYQIFHFNVGTDSSYHYNFKKSIDFLGIFSDKILELY